MSLLALVCFVPINCVDVFISILSWEAPRNITVCKNQLLTATSKGGVPLCLSSANFYAILSLVHREILPSKSSISGMYETGFLWISTQGMSLCLAV